MNSKTDANQFGGLRFLLLLGWGLPLIAYGGVVILSPDDTYSNFRILREASDLLRSWVLSISPMLDIYAHANTTTFVGTAKIASAFGFVCAAWIASFTMLFTLIVNKRLETSVDPTKVHDGFTNKQLFAGVTWIPIFGLAMMLAFFCIGGDPSFGQGFTTGNRIGYFFISVIAIVFAGVATGFWFFNVTVLFRRFFYKDES